METKTMKINRKNHQELKIRSAIGNVGINSLVNEYLERVLFGYEPRESTNSEFSSKSSEYSQ